MGIKARFAARKEAQGEEIEEHSLCVFIPDLVGYFIKNLSTKQAQGWPPLRLPPPSHRHTHPHSCGQGWPGRGGHLFTGQRADVEEEAAGDLPHHEGQMQDLSGELGHRDGVVVAIGDVQDILGDGDREREG